MIKAILACDAEGGVGKNNTLPWPKNSRDLKWFKDNTCIMNNHNFKFQKKAYICQKCGLIKRVVKHD